MTFMLLVTLTSLITTIIGKIKGFVNGTLTAPMWGHWFQLIFAVAMVVMAITLVIEGVKKYRQLKKNWREKSETDGDAREA